MVKRIAVDKSCGVIVDYQDFFLSQLEARSRYRLQSNTQISSGCSATSEFP